MKRARDIERHLEHLVEGLMGRIFKGRLHPVELGARLVREADLAVFEGDAGPTAPNAFVFRVHPRDLQGTTPPARLRVELAELLEATAVERGWRLEGPVEVRIDPDEGVSPGSVECHGEVKPGSLIPWAHLNEVGGDRRLPLRHNRCLVGRSSAMDVRLGVPEVSRRHALIWREGDQVWVADLASANGTYVDGTQIDRPALLYPGSVVSFGAAKFTYRPS